MLLAGQFELDRAPGLEGGQRQHILDEHFLLAAETAADPLAERPHLVLGKIEQIRHRAPGQERHLRTRPHIQHAVGVDPGDTAMGFQRGVLNPLCRERSLVGHCRLRQPGGDIAEFAMAFGHDVALEFETRCAAVLSPWMTGASGAIACAGSVTAGRIS